MGSADLGEALAMVRDAEGFAKCVEKALAPETREIELYRLSDAAKLLGDDKLAEMLFDEAEVRFLASQEQETWFIRYTYYEQRGLHAAAREAVADCSGFR